MSSTIQDIIVCTHDYHQIIDDVFDIIESFEKDPFHPDTHPIKAIFSNLQSLLMDCYQIEVHFDEYAKCVDYVSPVFPELQ